MYILSNLVKELDAAFSGVQFGGKVVSLGNLLSQINFVQLFGFFPNCVGFVVCLK